MKKTVHVLFAYPISSLNKRVKQRMRRQGEKTLVHLKYDIVSFIQVSNPGHPKKKKNEARIVVVKRRRRTFYALDATF